MTDLTKSIQLVDRDNPAAMPDAILNQFQGLATLLSSTIEDSHLSEQMINHLTLLHDQIATMQQEYSDILQDAVEERDTAYDNLAAAEEERDETRTLYRELQNAVRLVDGDHPLVSELIEAVEEMNMEYADELATENFIDMLVEKTNYSWSDCWAAANELTGWGGDPLSQETIELLTVFIEAAQKENKVEG